MNVIPLTVFHIVLPLNKAMVMAQLHLSHSNILLHVILRFSGSVVIFSFAVLDI